MISCPECGRQRESESNRCEHCGTGLATDGGATDGAGTGGGEKLEDDETNRKSPEGDRLSRRAMLGYTGAGAGVTFGGIGAGWFVFIREPMGPEEAVVEEYVNALDRAHFNTARDLYHRDSPGKRPTRENFRLMGDREIGVENTEITTRQEESDIETVDELALVETTVSADSPWGEEESFVTDFIVARNPEGDWKIWRDPDDIE